MFLKCIYIYYLFICCHLFFHISSANFHFMLRAKHYYMPHLLCLSARNYQKVCSLSANYQWLPLKEAFVCSVVFLFPHLLTTATMNLIQSKSNTRSHLNFQSWSASVKLRHSRVLRIQKRIVSRCLTWFSSIGSSEGNRPTKNEFIEKKK